MGKRGKLGIGLRPEGKKKKKKGEGRVGGWSNEWVRFFIFLIFTFIWLGRSSGYPIKKYKKHC